MKAGFINVLLKTVILIHKKNGHRSTHSAQLAISDRPQCKVIQQLSHLPNRHS